MDPCAEATSLEPSRAEDFSFRVHGADVIITHHGVTAVVLRGQAAARFLVDVEVADAQEVMARATGNYKRGNERRARQHPRNRSPS